MAYDLPERLVIGIASSALFDLKQSDAYFRKNGEAKYRKYQERRVDEPLDRGPAFSFVERLLGFNDLQPNNPLVEVILLSKNDPVTGLRVMNSVEHHGLDISRAVFSRGRQTHEYIPALSMSLFLSQNKADVEAAIEAGHPAGLLLSDPNHDDTAGRSLRVAFDFDGVLGGDSAEARFQRFGLGPYLDHEADHADEPLEPGPLKDLLKKLNRIQQVEQERASDDSTYLPRLRISLVTARNAPAHKRAVRSLQHWGVTVDEAFFLGGIEKTAVLGVLRPHIFFDDQVGHLADSSKYHAAVHIPYGISNLAAPAAPAMA